MTIETRASAETTLEFDEFFRVEYERLAKALLLVTGSRSDAEDLAQEALARAYERWERVKRMESPLGYVYRTALNLNRKRLRGIAVQRRRASEQRSEVDPIAGAENRAEVVRMTSA